MVYRHGSHIGSFAKGFSDSLLKVMQMQMMMEFYKSREDYMRAHERYWDSKAGGKGMDPGEQRAFDEGKAGYGTGGGGGDASQPRGLRNNNPGNIEDGDFAKSQPGYAGSDGRFAKFDTMDNGNAALGGLLTKSYGGMTVNQIFAKYAPAGENNPQAYAATVAKNTGLDPNSVPDLKDPAVMNKLKQAIISVENGVPYDKVPAYIAGRDQGGGGVNLVDASKSVNATGGANATQLNPAFANRVAALSADAEKATGQPLSFNELYRTYDQQAAIRAAHEAMPGGVAAHPAAPAGSSYHEFGAAGDMNDNAAARWARTPGPDGQTPIQKHGLETLPGQTGVNDPMHIQLPKGDWGKTAATDGSYQVAGDTSVALTPEEAAKSRADLEAHRAPADAPLDESWKTQPYGGHSTNWGPPKDTTAPAPAIPPVATINPQTDRSQFNTPLPPPRPVDANAPAPAAQPVSSSAPPAIPVTPRVRQDPRFTQVTAPNVDPTARNRPQMTALNLSHLWGPNPPLDQPAPAPAAPTPAPAAMPTRPDDWSGVASAPDMGDVSLGMQMGARKGGPIQRFQAAGPVSAQYPTYTPAPPVTPKYGLSGNALAADQYMTSLPGMTPVDLTQTMPWYYTDYGPGNIQGPGGMGLTADWSRMTPDQLSQYNAMVAGTWQPPAATPAATPAPAPAPAPVINPPSVQNIVNYAGTPSDPSGVIANDPTSTTTTGIPGVPTTGVTAKTYDPNAIATTGTGSATDTSGGTNYTTSAQDYTTQILSAKGGAIPPRPVTRFQAGGAAPGASAIMAAMNAPGYIGPTYQGGWQGTPYAQLAPNQQQWADQQQSLLAQSLNQAHQDYLYWSGGGRNPTGLGDTTQYWDQMTLMPDAIWPTQPSAPAPINEPPPSVQNITSPQANLQSTIQTIDPTSGTTTGTPQVPNILNPANTYDPNKIGTTGTGSGLDASGGTNYSVDPTGGTTQILSARGGPITPRVSRFDDGGGVSPSFAGMPPGMGGAAPVPPIYFNPATYSAAGAPVGKGVTQTSAPTYKAGAIPTIPMARGGVVGYDDGGEVDPTAGMMQTAMYDDMTDRQFDAEDKGAAAAPDTGFMPTSPAAFTQPAQQAQPQPAQAGGQPQPPPNDPSMAQVSDGQGNPSRGLIAAIGDGLHWLGDHLGIGGAQAAIASDPQTQTNRQNHVNGQNVADINHQTMEGFKDLQDPNHQLDEGYRTLAGMEGAYKWLLSQGREKEAAQMAAGMLQYSVTLSQNYSEQAAKELYDGNLKGAVDNINSAMEAVPDGRNIHAELSKDGRTITVTGSDLDGRVLWQKNGEAQAILEHATAMGRDGKLAWNALESQAARYDSTFKEMQANRQKNLVEGGKERAITEANTKFAPRLTPTTMAAPTAPAMPPSPTAPAAAPTTTATGGPGGTSSAPSPDSSGTAQANAPPATADSSKKGVLPGPPASPADVASPDAQPVDLSPDAERRGYADIVAKTTPTYFSPNGNPIINGQELAQPDQSQIRTPQDQAAYNEAVKYYQAAYQHNQSLMKADIDGQRRDFTASLNERRQEQAQIASEQRQQRTFEQQERMKRESADIQMNRDARLNQQKDALDKSNAVFKSNLTGSAPRSDQEMQSLAGEGKVYDPMVMLARSFNPDLPENTDRTTAMNFLKQQGFDANTQNVLASAWDQGVRHSRNTDPAEVGQALQSYITGGQFTASAEAVDANGRPTPQHGVVRYDLTVEDNSGNHVSVRLPMSDMLNLRNLRERYAGQQVDRLGQQIQTQGLLPLIGGPRGGYGQDPAAAETWQPPM